MENLSKLEGLEPEIQTLIMCHVSDVATLYALIHSSPRFYQVFLSRRDYHLTQMAIGHSQSPSNAWDAIRASRLPRPLSGEDIAHFMEAFWEDETFKAPVISPEITIPMIKLERCVEWLTADFARDALANLVKLAQLTGQHRDEYSLKQDTAAVQQKLSEVEKERIARAFFRFETFRNLFPPTVTDDQPSNVSQTAIGFLQGFDADETEEIVCIRDYFIRRLWHMYDGIEDDFARGELEPTIETGLSRDESWFGPERKNEHEYYMEHMMSLGLEFMQSLLAADPMRRTRLVLSNSERATGFLSDAFEKMRDDRFLNGASTVRQPTELVWRKYVESADYFSTGWKWARTGMSIAQPGDNRMKGCRDWGYLFWGRPRMQAAGVLGNR